VLVDASATSPPTTDAAALHVALAPASIASAALAIASRLGAGLSVGRVEFGSRLARNHGETLHRGPCERRLKKARAGVESEASA